MTGPGATTVPTAGFAAGRQRSRSPRAASHAAVASAGTGAEHVGRGRERYKLGNIVIPRSIESQLSQNPRQESNKPTAANPAVGTVVVAPGPAVPTTVAPSPYNSSYPPTAGGVVQGHVAQPPPYGAASTGAVVQAEVVAAAPMDRK